MKKSSALKFFKMGKYYYFAFNCQTYRLTHYCILNKIIENLTMPVKVFFYKMPYSEIRNIIDFLKTFSKELTFYKVDTRSLYKPFLKLM